MRLAIRLRRVRRCLDRLVTSGRGVYPNRRSGNREAKVLFQHYEARNTYTGSLLPYTPIAMLIRCFPALLLLALSYTALSQGNSSLDVSVGAGFAFRSLSYAGEDPGVISAIQYRRDEESPGHAYRAALHYNHRLSRHFFLRAGLRVTRTGYVNEWITDLRWGHQHDGNGGFDPDLARDIKTTSSHWFVELPVAGRLEWGSGRWTPFLEMGLAPALYQSTYSERTTDVPVPVITRGRQEGIRSVHLIASLSAGCAYRLSPTWQMFGQPTFRYHLTPLAEGSIKERLFNYGLELGLRRAL